MREIGCCGSWSVCSQGEVCPEEAICVNPKLKDECSYAEHLSNGLNFLNSVFKAGPYLEVAERLFYIGVASGNSSRRIGEHLASNLRELGLQIVPFTLAKARVERPAGKDNCGFKVVFTLSGETFVVKNVNVRALLQESAEVVADTLRSIGLTAHVLTVDTNRSPARKLPAVPIEVQTLPAAPPAVVPKHGDGVIAEHGIIPLAHTEEETESKGTEEPVENAPTPKAAYVQLNLFDMV